MSEQPKTGIDCQLCGANRSLSELDRYSLFICEEGHDYAEEMASLEWHDKGIDQLRREAMSLLALLPKQAQEIARLRVIRYAVKLEQEGQYQEWLRNEQAREKIATP